MKRVKSACILQTLVFSQLADKRYSREYALKVNQQEIEHYKATLERAKTQYQIVSIENQDDGSIVVHVKKQHNNADPSEYFN